MILYKNAFYKLNKENTTTIKKSKYSEQIKYELSKPVIITKLWQNPRKVNYRYSSYVKNSWR